MKGWNTFVKGTEGIPFGNIWDYISAVDNNNNPVTIDKKSLSLGSERYL